LSDKGKERTDMKNWYLSLVFNLCRSLLQIYRGGGGAVRRAPLLAQGRRGNLHWDDPVKSTDMVSMIKGEHAKPLGDWRGFKHILRQEGVS